MITINKEDYELASSKFKKCKDIEYVEGVGICSEKFDICMSDKEKLNLKKELGLNLKDFILCYVAEQTKRKNQVMAINAMKEIVKNNKNIKLLLVGNGTLQSKYHDLISKNDLNNNIFMLGYRRDIPNIMKITDIYISTSTQEGLPVNIMEALCSKLPIISTNCRGNRDLIINGENGYLVNINDVQTLSCYILELYNNSELRNEMSINTTKYIEPFLEKNVMNKMKKIYLNIN